MATHNKEYRLYEIQSEWWLNRYRMATITETKCPWQGGESDFQNCHTIILKYTDFQQQSIWGMQRDKKL